MREGPDRAGEFADAHIFGSAVEAFDISLCLGIPVGQLEAEGDRLGVDAMSATDHGSIFELPCAALEDIGKLTEIDGDDF